MGGMPAAVRECKKAETGAKVSVPDLFLANPIPSDWVTKWGIGGAKRDLLVHDVKAKSWWLIHGAWISEIGREAILSIDFVETANAPEGYKGPN